MRKANYIIVGQGIAGSVLAHTLIKHGHDITVIDQPFHSTASRVAAGLYNPVVFKRLTTSWKINELLPFAEAYYRDAEKTLGGNYFFKKSITKFFTEEQEKLLWQKKLNEPGVSTYLSPSVYPMTIPGVNPTSWGCADVLNAGYLDIKSFVNDVRNQLLERKCLVEELVDYNLLLVDEKGVSYKQWDADKVIFCEGFRARENPYFSWLPFKPAKGEVLTIQSKELNLTTILNKGIFILPIGNNLYKVGATYEWDSLTDQPTEKGKNELLQKLKNLLSCDFIVLEHEAGIRPTVADRRPFLGIHPRHASLAVFNGLGTKGVMLAPYFAHELMEHLVNGKSLGPEVDIQRCFRG